MPSLDPHDHTPVSAQAEFYPNLTPEQIGLFEIVYMDEGATENDYCYLWLPLDPIAQTDALQGQFDVILDITREQEKVA